MKSAELTFGSVSLLFRLLTIRTRTPRHAAEPVMEEFVRNPVRAVAAVPAVGTNAFDACHPGPRTGNPDMDAPVDPLLHLYRERCGHPGFWAEPVNAITNASFLIAAFAGWHLAARRGALTEGTWSLLVLAAAIGCGSFLFHTLVNQWTMWLDVVPIALFQIAFLWLAGRSMLHLSAAGAAGTVALVIGLSFAAMPLHGPLNGSLFYVPALIAMIAYGAVAVLQRQPEPWLLLAAAAIFSLSIIARSVDLKVPFTVGTHFLWHLLNGAVLYLAMRAWILHVAKRIQPV